MTTPIRSPKKLIEVALPLDDINAAAAREKSIRHGHPSTLHLWWARRPLAAARAVLFAQLVNDPGYQTGEGFTRGVNRKAAELERERLFGIIRELVKWENTNNETVLNAARAEIRKSWEETCRLNARHPQAAELFNPHKLPAFHDPFAGGGAIPLEAQRLGLESHASDLNPVPVLINKAMIEIPPKFAGQAPVGPLPAGEKQVAMHEDWSGARGMAEDVRRYSHWMHEEAKKRIGHLYPTVEITKAMTKGRSDLEPLLGQQLTVIAWLWARTVRSPNPAYSTVRVPLASTFLLSTKKDKEAWVEPIVTDSGYRFEVRTTAAGHGKPPPSAKNGTKLSRGANFRCIMSDTPIEPSYVKEEGKKGRIGEILMAVVAEGPSGRVFLSPNEASAVEVDAPAWLPDMEFAKNSRHMTPWAYGMGNFAALFNRRQAYALWVLSDLVPKAGEMAARAYRLASSLDGAAYGAAVATYLAFYVSRLINLNNSLCQWRNDPAKLHVGHMFSRQAIPMVWDYAEANLLGSSAGSMLKSIEFVPKAIEMLPARAAGFVVQRNAAVQEISRNKVVSTDPPYYDNVPYADLSDFFYVWLRKCLRGSYPELFTTVATPKAEELVADALRQGGADAAEMFFMSGMTEAMRRVSSQANPTIPTTIYYAFKQGESGDLGTSSTGWETFLDAVIAAGFAIVGTWPIRTELGNRIRGRASNALASSVVLVCRLRESGVGTVSRKEFLRELKAELSDALEAMLGGAGGASPIAPVDLAQAAIGPGMAVFSRYVAVLEANGEAMSVHSALTLINKQVEEILDPDAVGDLDADTKFCAAWFKQHGWSAGAFGEANTLAQAKATSVDGVAGAGVVESKGGKVKLLKPADYSADWDPTEDNRTPVWEALHQLIRALNQGGEATAGALLARMPERAGHIRQLATWLYTLCERNKWADDARNYNELVTAWHGIEAASHEAGQVNVQGSLDV